LVIIIDGLNECLNENAQAISESATSKLSVDGVLFSLAYLQFCLMVYYAQTEQPIKYTHKDMTCDTTQGHHGGALYAFSFHSLEKYKFKLRDLTV
jgi:hypothetical protein